MSSEFWVVALGLRMYLLLNPKPPSTSEPSLQHECEDVEEPPSEQESLCLCERLETSIVSHT